MVTRGGVKKLEYSGDIIYEWPLTSIAAVKQTVFLFQKPHYCLAKIAECYQVCLRVDLSISGEHRNHNSLGSFL